MYSGNVSQVCKKLKQEKLKPQADHRLGACYKITPNQGHIPTGHTTDEILPEVLDDLKVN